MFIFRFRLTDKIGFDGLEGNDDGVSGCAGIKGESGNSLEKVSSHFSTKTSDICAVMTEVVDMWWEMCCRVLDDAEPLVGYGPSFRRCSPSNNT